MQVPDAEKYGTHSFRRGHAQVILICRQVCHLRPLCIQLQDLMEGGATLAQILRAGQWKSAAFLGYLNQADIEKAHAQD